MKTEFYLSLDWLSFTFKPNLSIIDIDSVLSQFSNAFPELENIIYECEKASIVSHYDVSLAWNFRDMFINYNVIEPDSESSVHAMEHRLKMGVNVQVPSHSIELFFNLFGFSVGDDLAVCRMMQLLTSRNCTLSRLDLCYDDFVKKYTAWDYICFYTNNRIASPFINSVTTFGNRMDGYTIYFGSLKKRSKILRIYDKYLESHGIVDSVRYEFEVHGDSAKRLQRDLCSKYKDGIPFSNFLSGWIKVKEPNNFALENLRNAPDCVEWLVYIASLAFDTDELNNISLDAFNLNLTLSSLLVPIHLEPLHKDSDDYDLDSFLIHQAMPSIVGALDLHGQQWFDNQIKKARSSGRINPKYRREITKLKNSSEYWQDTKYFDNPFR